MNLSIIIRKKSLKKSSSDSVLIEIQNCTSAIPQSPVEFSKQTLKKFLARIIGILYKCLRFFGKQHIRQNLWEKDFLKKPTEKFLKKLIEKSVLNFHKFFLVKFSEELMVDSLWQSEKNELPNESLDF